jgi:alkylhydroperoxidase family enzyme
MVPGGEPRRRADQRDPRPDGAWGEKRPFSDAERAALEYAGALTRASDTTVTQVFEPYHDGLTVHFDEVEMREVVAVGVTMDMWTRLELAAEGAMPSPG